MFEKIKEILMNYTKVTDIRPESELQRDLGLDSFQSISLIVEIEDKFNITIDDTEIQSFFTVGDIVSYAGKNCNV